MKGIEINEILVKDIMSQTAVVAKKGETLSEVISKLKKDHVREVPVLEGNKPIGLVSYTSFLLRRSVPLSAKVEQVMRPVPRLEEDMSVPAAVEELMSAGVRGAPVVRNQRMVGFMSRTDVIKILPKVEAIKSRKVSEFMSSDPQAVYEKESVRKAQMMMKGLMEKSLPVVDKGGRLVGAVSMSDVLDVLWSPKATKPANKLMGGRERPEIAVGSVMSRPPVSVSADDTLEKVARVMSSERVATVFVVEDSKLVGVVSQADLMEQVLTLKEKKGVYVQITGLGEEDPDVYDIMYDLIGRSMRRIDKIQFPQVFTVHVQAYNSAGLRSKYSLHGRLTTEHKMYYANATDWDLYKTLDELLNQLEKSIKKEHERVLDMRKKKQGS